MRATVLVRPKAGILDPQGEAVESSLRQLGFPVEQARVGRLVDVELDQPPDARRADREPEVLERALHRLALRVEDARLRADEDGCPHRSTTLGSAR